MKSRLETSLHPHAHGAVNSAVATTTVGRLPIFWRTRPGPEIVRPLAGPVVRRILSTFVHNLVVTPMTFGWLRERGLAEITP